MTATGRGTPAAANGRAPKRVVHAATLLLASLTALALLALALTPGSPLLPAERAPSASPRVRAFYAAVNTLLAGDDGAALAPLVAPAVNAQFPDGRHVTGQPALLNYWRTLGHGASTLRVTLEGIFVDGDQAVATIAPIVPAAPWPDLAVLGPVAAHPVTERFRFAQGRIVDYWAGLDPRALPQAWPPLPMPLVAGPMAASLVRFALPPHAALTDLVSSGPHLLLPQLGALTVRAEGSVQIVHAAAPQAGWRATAAPTTLTLQPGDAALIPSDVRHTLRNDTATAAVLLGVALMPLTELANAPLPSLLDLYRPGIDGRPIGQTGVTATWLARGIDHAPTASTTLRLATLVLATGQIVAPDRVGGVTLVAGDRGVALTDHAPAPAQAPTLPVAAAAGAAGAAGAADAHDTASQVTGPEPTSPANDTLGVVAAGDGAALSTGMRGRIANAGDESARVTLIVLGPGAEPLANVTLSAPMPAAGAAG